MPSGMTRALTRAWSGPSSAVLVGERDEITRGILGSVSPDPLCGRRSFRLWSQPEGPGMGQLLASAPSDFRVTQSTEEARA